MVKLELDLASKHTEKSINTNTRIHTNVHTLIKIKLLWTNNNMQQYVCVCVCWKENCGLGKFFDKLFSKI